MIVFIRKHIYLFSFITMFLFKSVWDYFNAGHFSWLENLLYSLWFVVVYAFINWAWDSKKYEKK